MSADVLEILYVGNPVAGESFRACVESFGWTVYVPVNRLQALGMFIDYIPHVVILDTLQDPALTRDVYFHMRTVDTTPVIFLGTSSEFADDTTRTLLPSVPMSTL